MRQKGPARTTQRTQFFLGQLQTNKRLYCNNTNAFLCEISIQKLWHLKKPANFMIILALYIYSKNVMKYQT